MRKWPCYFFKSETTGEKDFEEFFSADSDLDLDKFATIGIIKNKSEPHTKILIVFSKKLIIFIRMVLGQKMSLSIVLMRF